MREVLVTLAGQEYPLLFNGAAMFSVREKFGDGNLAELIAPNTAEAFNNLCQLIGVLAEQAELARRYMGHSAGAILTADMVRALASPLDMIVLKQAAIRAVILGYGRDIPDNDEVDLLLSEIQKKTEIS